VADPLYWSNYDKIITYRSHPTRSAAWSADGEHDAYDVSY